MAHRSGSPRNVLFSRHCPCSDIFETRPLWGEMAPTFAAIGCRWQMETRIKSFPELFTVIIRGGFFGVNNSTKTARACSFFERDSAALKKSWIAPTVNKAVHKITLLDSKYLLRCSQFIERAETGGDDQQIGAKSLKDNPRQLGKGWARLVGSSPHKPGRKARQRQDSPVPLAAFARRQLRERNCAVRSDKKPLRTESSNPEKFRVRVNGSYPEGIRLLLCISTGGRLWRSPKKRSAKGKTLKGGTK